METLEIAQLSRRLLRALNYSGFVGVEFKFDARDSTYRLIEINARTVSGNQLAISAGIDFPWIAYQYLTVSDSGTANGRPFRPMVKCVNEEWDVQAYVAIRKSGALNLWSWLRFAPRIEVHHWRMGCPAPPGDWFLAVVA